MKKFNYILLFIIINIINRTHLIEGAPDPPHDLSIDVKSGKTVELNWKPPHDGIVSSYKVTIIPLSEQDETGVRNIRVGSSDALPISIRDLTPGASYEVQLHSVYLNKASNAFVSTNFTTKPNTPGRLIVWFRNETTLLVLWQPPYPAAIFDQYRVSINPEDAVQSVFNVVKESEPPGPAQAAFYGLVPGRAYNVSVRTVSKSQLSEPLEAIFSTASSPHTSGESTPQTPTIKTSVPMFTSGGPPSEMTILDGRDAEIQCEASGTPTPTVEWFLNQSHKLDLTNRKYQINNSGALVITPVEKGDEAVYTCVRSNSFGTINGSTSLHVIVRTHIDQPPVDSKVILSSTAELQCRVRHDSSVPIKIYWTFNGRNTTSSSRVKVMADGTLRIEQVRNTDVGLYTCRVESIGGNEKRSARLDVIELPHPPTNVRAELNINGGLVNVSWSPPFDGNSPIVKYIVQMRTVSHTNGNQENADEDLIYGAHSWTTASMNISASQNYVLLTNLRPAMTYQFRVSAVNNVGEGQASAPTSPPITLPAQPPNASPIGVVGAPRSSTAIMIQWQPPPTESHNGQLMGYMVRYKLAGYAEHTQWYQHNVTNAAQLSYLLDDLIVWQNYQIQIAAYNEMGVGAYSQSIFVRTKEGRPASQVRQLSVEAINSTAIEVHWQSPDPQLINGINQGYKLQAWKSINQSLSPYNELFKEVIVPPAPFPERSQSAIMDGLEPYTTYYITALCFTSAGDGPKTDAPKVVTTQQDLPEEVSQFKFTDILDKSVRVLWSSPKRVNGKLLGYTLKYYVVGSNEGQKQIVNFTAQQNETIVSNLRPQTAYTFEMNAWTQVGAGPVESSTIQSSVPPVLPQPPTHLAISNIGAFSVVLQFTPGFNGNASISKWIVEGQLFKLRNANWSVIYESTNHTQNDAIVVHNLRPYTEYRLRLSPVNVVGKSLSPSESSPPFQTLQALPAGPPMNVTLRTVSPTALRVRWTPLPPESWYGHPRGYNVTWSEIDDEGLQSTIHSFISDDYHSHSFLITSLEEFTRYGVQVYALNDLGSSPASRLIVQRTNEATPSSGPDSVVVKATSSTTIVVDWGEITKVDRNGILQGFKVKYTSFKSSDSTQYKIIESNQTRTTTLTELKKYTTYRISVCGFTHAGDGVYSTSLTEQTFQDVPGPPSNVTFPDVTHTTARIQWDIPLEPNGQILAYRISYKMSDEDFKRAISREFTSTDRTHRFLDLRPETYYIFEVTAKTIEGWGKAAKLIVYTTNSRELPSHPSQPLISTSQISSRQVTISWTPGRDGFAPLRYYTAQISSQGGHWWTYPHKIDPTLRIYTITNLKPFTTYQFRIKATNDIGDSGWSLESPITRTLPAPPDKAPLSVIVSPFTPTSVAVKWTEIQDWNGDEIGAGYRIQYCIISPQGVSSSCPSSIVRGKNITTVSIENLERDQHYEIRVIAFNGQGDGPSSKAKVVYVGEAVPTGEPLNISTLPLSSTEVKVTWSPPDKDKQNGQLMGYKIFYWQQTESQHKVNDMQRANHQNIPIFYEQPREMMEIVPDTCESFILLDLLKWSNYSIQISAFNPAGDGPRSRAIVVQTKEDIPGEVGHLNFDEITMSQVKVSWRPPIEPNGILLGYYVTYETLINDFSKQVKQKINDSYLVVNGLRERVMYTFKVRAETSAGVGPETVGNVTTGPQPGSPPPPIDIISTQTLTSVKLKWKNPDYRDIIGYLIEANNLNKKGALEWQPVSLIKNGRQDRYELSFTHLAPSSQYTFRVMAMNEKGVSEPAYPDKVIGSSIIETPSHLELRARMPYYRESWFVILCACLSVVITIMVIAVLCVRNKTYKYKQEAKKGSQDRLSEVGFGLDDNIDNHYPTGFEMRQHNPLSSQQRRSNGTLSTTVSLAATKSPPRPSPGSITYSDDEEDDDDDDIKGAAIYESSGESLTEKPSEMSSSGPESESEHDDASAANHFVNHYANVNDTLRKGQQSWKRHAKPYVVPTHHRLSMPSRPAPPAPPPPSYLAAIAINASEDSELDSPSVNLNGGRIIVNNMAGSRAPLPGFSSFV